MTWAHWNHSGVFWIRSTGGYRPTSNSQLFFLDGTGWRGMRGKKASFHPGRRDKKKCDRNTKGRKNPQESRGKKRSRWSMWRKKIEIGKYRNNFCCGASIIRLDMHFVMVPSWLNPDCSSALRDMNPHLNYTEQTVTQRPNAVGNSSSHCKKMFMWICVCITVTSEHNVCLNTHISGLQQGLISQIHAMLVFMALKTRKVSTLLLFPLISVTLSTRPHSDFPIFSLQLTSPILTPSSPLSSPFSYSKWHSEMSTCRRQSQSSHGHSLIFSATYCQDCLLANVSVISFTICSTLGLLFDISQTNSKCS